MLSITGVIFLNDNILTCEKFNCFWFLLEEVGKVRNVGEDGLPHHIVLARSGGEGVRWADVAIIGKQSEFPKRLFPDDYCMSTMG
jgi:hypothetical protein